MTDRTGSRRLWGNGRRLPARSLGALLAGAAIVAGSTAAFAYRPFDGTDAAVADPNEVEIELQPAGTLRQDFARP